MSETSEEWSPMDTHPKDGSEFLVKLSNGRVLIAEYWEGPPGKEEEWGGIATNVTVSFGQGTIREDCEAEMVGWKRSEARENDLPWQIPE